MKNTSLKLWISAILLITLSVFYSACRKDADNGNQTTDAYILQVPPGFPEALLSAENPLSRAGIALGRRLYYDTLLSVGGPLNGQACASCHFQNKGFTRTDIPVLAHVNLAWNRNFLWKGEITGSLEEIMVFEVNDFFQSDLSGLHRDPLYPGLYAAAFGDQAITPQKTAFALAQFVKTLISGNSPYDRYLQGKASLPAAALRGADLFYSEKGDCFHCHGNALFTDNAFHNIGLRNRSSADMGRYLVTGAASDVGKFKTPTLRNTALKNVYMHDGRFKSLYEVVNHYNLGVQHTEYLDPILDKPPLNLSTDEINDLVAFLETLTDTTFLSDPAFSKP